MLGGARVAFVLGDRSLAEARLNEAVALIHACRKERGFLDDTSGIDVLRQAKKLSDARTTGKRSRHVR